MALQDNGKDFSSFVNDAQITGDWANVLPATLISFTTGMIFRPAMPPLAFAHSTSALIWAVSSPMAVDTAAEPPRLTTEMIPIFTVVSVTPCESPVSGKSTAAAGAAVAAGADAAGAAVVGAAVTGAVTLTQRLALPTCLHCSDPSVVPTLAHVPPDLAAAPAVPVNNVAPSKANDAPAMTALFDACKMNPPVRQATMCRPSPPRRLTKRQTAMSHQLGSTRPERIARLPGAARSRPTHLRRRTTHLGAEMHECSLPDPRWEQGTRRWERDIRTAGEPRRYG